MLTLSYDEYRTREFRHLLYAIYIPETHSSIDQYPSAKLHYRQVLQLQTNIRMLTVSTRREVALRLQTVPDQNKLYAGMRAAATICPRPSPPSVGAEAPPSTKQRSSSFPRPIRSQSHRCSCLTR